MLAISAFKQTSHALLYITHTARLQTQPHLVTISTKPCGIITRKARLQMQHYLMTIRIKLYSIISQVKL